MKIIRILSGLLILSLLQGCYTQLLNSDSGDVEYYDEDTEYEAEQEPDIIIIEVPPPVYIAPPVLIAPNPGPEKKTDSVNKKDPEKPKDDENNTRNNSGSDRNFQKRKHR